MRFEPQPEELARHTASLSEIGRFLALMTRLRGPGGCPWDQKQTFESLRPYLIEETYEVIDAIDAGDAEGHVEELGDLLLQIVFHAEISREAGRWDMGAVAAGVTDKLYQRHPHVFAEVAAATPEEALQSWETVKAQEKARKGKARESVLDGVPKAAPALNRAERLSDKAAGVGFDWPDAAGARDKVREELAELDEAIAAGDPRAIEGELGDLLFAVVNLGRKLGLHSEDALRGTLRRFEARFRHLEQGLAAEGKRPSDLDLESLDARWEVAKEVTSDT